MESLRRELRSQIKTVLMERFTLREFEGHHSLILWGSLQTQLVNGLERMIHNQLIDDLENEWPEDSSA